MAGKPQIPPERRRRVVALYTAENLSTRAISDRMNIARQTVQRILAEFGVTKRRGGAPTLYACDETYFDTIDTEAKAYWLGFLAADGCVDDDGVRLVLAAGDASHVAEFRNALGSTHPIWPDHTRRAVGVAIPRGMLRNALADHGVTQRKSLTLTWPTTVPDDLLRHFARGYFDGDGTWRTRSKAGPGFGVLGTPGFLGGFRALLMAGAGLREVKLCRSGHSAHVKSLEYGGRHQVERIYRLLYDDATIWLPRKRDKIDVALEH